MKAEIKYSMMIWAITTLAVMNVVTIVTVMHNRNQAQKENPFVEINKPDSENVSIEYSGRYFRDQLNFSNEQMARFVEFNPSFRESVRNINNDLNILRKKMLYEMGSENIDTHRLDVLSDSIGILHSNLKKATYKYYMDIKKICDKHQKEKLEQLFSRIFINDDRMGRFGKGRQQGRHHGRQFND